MKARIRNWERFQHYSKRNPPWIKLHVEILSSRDWVTLNNDGRVLAIACMVLASRGGGEIDLDPEYFQRVAYLKKKPDFQPLITCGFLELEKDASGCKRTLADASVYASVSDSVSVKEGGTGGTKKFKPPTLDEVRAYVAEKGYTFDPETFHAYYESQGWKKANGRPVESWHGCCVTFQKRETPRKAQAGATPDHHGMWSREDEAAHKDHPRWDEYTEAMLDWQSTSERPSFKVWLEGNEKW
jgi:hypothetical protein